MKLLKYAIAIIGVLHYVETKAFQTSKDNVKGTYDHMYENLYLKKSTSNKDGDQNYEMRYVPHVDGKPIFIPLDEFEASTLNVLKAKPTQFRYKPKLESTKLLPLKNKAETEHTLKKNVENLKVSKYLKENPTKVDHPVVIDVVTKGYNFNHDMKDTSVIEPTKEQPDFKEIELSEHIKHPSISSMKHEAYGMGSDKSASKKQTDGLNYDSSPNHNSVSKHKAKENILNFRAEDVNSINEEISVSNHKDSPVVVESITKDYDDPIVIRPFKEKPKESNKGKLEVPNKKPIEEDLKIKETYTKKFEKKELKQKKPFNHVNYDSPVVIETLAKETTEDYNPIVIRPFSEKHSIDKKDEINKPVIKDILKHKIKPGSYMDTKMPEKESNYKFTKSPLNLSEISIYQKDNPVEIKNSQYKIGSKSNYSSTENILKDYPLSSEVDHSIDSFSQDSGYYEEYDSDEEYQNNDSQVIVEALVKKSDQNKDSETHKVKNTLADHYDKPIVVEALLKKTDEINAEDYDKPIVSAALIKKHPAKNGVEQNKDSKDASETNYEAPVVVEALVNKSPVKHNKKRIKYSTKMKPQKSFTHSYYEDSFQKNPSTENLELFNFADQEKSKIPNVIKAQENIVTNSPEQSNREIFSNEDLLDFESLGDNNAGSGFINERKDDSRSLSSKSNVWPILTSFHSQERNKFKKCTTPNDEPGNCMPIQMCPTPNLQLTLDDLLKKICAIDEVFIGICCPEFPAETLKVDWESFKNDSSDDQEGFEAKTEGCGKIKEFGKDPQSWPWMAPLISVSTRRIFCGGVLIKEQYVLTAAHCTRKIPRNQIVVVLGPSAKDSTPQEFEVIEIKRHAQYNPRTMQNDLALLKLSRKVRRPFICLPETGETFVGKESLMLGWQGSFAASKSEEKLLVISPQECRKGATKIVVGDNIMCTEPRTEDVMCNVDSGAPLVIKSDERYEVIGILTWNRNDCDSSFPAIFTRVSHFRGWIENHAI